MRPLLSGDILRNKSPTSGGGVTFLTTARWIIDRYYSHSLSGSFFIPGSHANVSMVEHVHKCACAS